MRAQAFRHDRRDLLDARAPALDGAEPSGYKSLSAMLVPMMVAAVDDRKKWHAIGDDVWPAYTELLVRAGVCEMHKDDSKKLRLQKFF